LQRQMRAGWKPAVPVGVSLCKPTPLTPARGAGGLSAPSLASCPAVRLFAGRRGVFAVSPPPSEPYVRLSPYTAQARHPSPGPRSKITTLRTRRRMAMRVRLRIKSVSNICRIFSALPSSWVAYLTHVSHLSVGYYPIRPVMNFRCFSAACIRFLGHRIPLEDLPPLPLAYWRLGYFSFTPARPPLGFHVSRLRDTTGVGVLYTPGPWCPHVGRV
jgi:hypothetical protein